MFGITVPTRNQLFWAIVLAFAVIAIVSRWSTLDKLVTGKAPRANAT
jgi:hypothetical protein